MKKYILLLVLLSAVLLISCTPAEKVCSVDTDCGQGEIKCLEGSCQVVLNE